MVRWSVATTAVLISAMAASQEAVRFEGRIDHEQRVAAMKGQACGSDDARVGYEAGLRRRAHGVTGTARIVDNCTIMIEEFNYDGGGVDVRVYGFTNQNFDGGVSLSQDLRRDTPYVNEMLTVNLPSNVSLDDVAVISIWCVPVATSFGDGEFVEPGMEPDGMDSGCPAAAGRGLRGSSRSWDMAFALSIVVALSWRRNARGPGRY